MSICQCLIRIRLDWKYSPIKINSKDKPLIAVEKSHHHHHQNIQKCLMHPLCCAVTSIWLANHNMYLQNKSVCRKGANDSLSTRADWKRAVPPTWAVWFCNLYWDFTCLKRFTNVYLNEKKYCCFGLVGSLHSKGLACTVINKYTQHW